MCTCTTCISSRTCDTIQSKDSAAKVVRLAKAIHEEAPDLLRGIRLVKSIDVTHAENRLHKLIATWGLALPVFMSFLKQGLRHVPMLHVPDWFSCLLEHRPEVLLAGYSVEDEDLGRHLLAFWSAYRQEDPSHPIFQTHQGHLDACLPYFLFGDEGRGHRKSPVMIFAFEVVLGLRTKAVYEENMMTAPDLRGEAKALLAAQQHAAKLSSLKSRFLLAVVPHLWYKGKQVHVYRNTLDALSAKCKDLFHSGVQHRGKKFYGILLGVKGDSPALTKMGTLNRAYNRLGFDKGICPFCLGGKDNFPWEDMSSEAAWQSTIGKVRPWDTNCSNKLLDIPFSLDVPEFVFRVWAECMGTERTALGFQYKNSNLGSNKFKSF